MGQIVCSPYPSNSVSTADALHHVCIASSVFVYFPSVLWYCWLGLLTCKNRLPYNLYCVGGDVKHCTIQSNPVLYAVNAWWGFKPVLPVANRQRLKLKALIKHDICTELCTADTSILSENWIQWPHNILDKSYPTRARAKKTRVQSQKKKSL